MAKIKVGYTPNNRADVVKSGVLKAVLSNISKQGVPFFYFECHSGEGRYEKSLGCFYDGSAFQARDILKRVTSLDPEMVLHEIKKNPRAELVKNTDGWPSLTVGSDWTKDVNKYLPKMDNNGLVFSDPTFFEDHRPILERAPEILATGIPMMVYLPEGVGVNNKNGQFEFRGKTYTKRELADATFRLLDDKKPEDNALIEVCYPACGGALERIDHFYLVVPRDVSKQVKQESLEAALAGEPQRGKEAKKRYKGLVKVIEGS
ncbi:MAG: hypothetical protein NUV97_03425 [archaeon]|nr:hypothetical protein [archaeon]MCR4323569.1 hypothetical protein [Nanoarchaeota archaeon]